ncbi:hypothetical protein [Aquimarina intermedia]|uniref:Uncharacterized protein n=1 Tax=Aquimarina intermedia TaxID=350814 RepID=A0A5S5C4C0_9FLAO|nr:hypothetical protein [Aquimarina intermedia]TYP72803.1 hypothetical protein BD809_10651 [Aquimarina intermedia]
MSQIKTQTPSQEKTPKTTISTKAFIPLFFEDLSVQIEQNNNFAIAPSPNWKYAILQMQSFTSTLDHPPEFYFS